MNDQDRIDQLVGKVNRLQRLNYVMASLMIVGVLIAATDTQQVVPTLRANRIEIVRSDGRVAGSLGTLPNGSGVLFLHNSAGKVCLGLSSTDSGTGMVTTHNMAGQDIIRLTATSRGEGVIATFNAVGKEMVTVSTTTEGCGSVSTFNGRGQELAGLWASKGGEGLLRLFSGRGQLLGYFGPDPNRPLRGQLATFSGGEVSHTVP